MPRCTLVAALVDQLQRSHGLLRDAGGESDAVGAAYLAGAAISNLVDPRQRDKPAPNELNSRCSSTHASSSH
jgi:hypothetical protein